MGLSSVLLHAAKAISSAAHPMIDFLLSVNMVPSYPFLISDLFVIGKNWTFRRYTSSVSFSLVAISMILLRNAAISSTISW